MRIDTIEYARRKGCAVIEVNGKDNISARLTESGKRQVGKSVTVEEIEVAKASGQFTAEQIAKLETFVLRR